MSNPEVVLQNAKQYLGKDVVIDYSTRANNKFMVLNPLNKWVHFGQKGYEDFTQHKDIKRRDAYLKRASRIKGHWKEDKYSPNNLSMNILWR